MPNTFELRVVSDRVPELLKIWSREAGKVMARVALLTEAHAKANIQSNGTIETGAMLNGVYTVSAEGDHAAAGVGAVESRRPGKAIGAGGELEDVSDKEASAAVACAAEYAVYIEFGGHPFLLPAADSAEGELESLAKQLFLSDF